MKRWIFCLFTGISLVLCVLEFLRSLRFDHGAERAMGMFWWGVGGILVLAAAVRLWSDKDEWR